MVYYRTWMVLWIQYRHVPVDIVRVDNSSCGAPIFVHHFAADDNEHSQADDPNDTSYYNPSDRTRTSTKMGMRVHVNFNACIYKIS